MELSQMNIGDGAVMEDVHPSLNLGSEILGCVWGGCSFRREDEVDSPTQTLVQDILNLAGQRFKYGT